MSQSSENQYSDTLSSISFAFRFNTPENRERMKASYALRREGTADEVADLVCFLACSESSYLTGTNIDINGGCFFS